MEKSKQIKTQKDLNTVEKSTYIINIMNYNKGEKWNKNKLLKTQ